MFELCAEAHNVPVKVTKNVIGFVRHICDMELIEADISRQEGVYIASNGGFYNNARISGLARRNIELPSGGIPSYMLELKMHPSVNKVASELCSSAEFYAVRTPK